jgi:hypothetical protein
MPLQFVMGDVIPGAPAGFLDVSFLCTKETAEALACSINAEVISSNCDLHILRCREIDAS